MRKSSSKNPVKELAEELDAPDGMIAALVQLLEKKKILTQEEWEDEIKRQLTKAKGAMKYRDLQFSIDK